MLLGGRQMILEKINVLTLQCVYFLIFILSYLIILCCYDPGHTHVLCVMIRGIRMYCVCVSQKPFGGRQGPRISTNIVLGVAGQKS